MSITTKYKLIECNDGFDRFYQTLKEARVSQQKNGGKIYKHIIRMVYREVQ